MADAPQAAEVQHAQCEVAAQLANYVVDGVPCTGGMKRQLRRNPVWLRAAWCFRRCFHPAAALNPCLYLDPALLPFHSQSPQPLHAMPCFLTTPSPLVPASLHPCQAAKEVVVPPEVSPCVLVVPSKYWQCSAPTGGGNAAPQLGWQCSTPTGVAGQCLRWWQGSASTAGRAATQRRSCCTWTCPAGTVPAPLVCRGRQAGWQLGLRPVAQLFGD